ncbi:hypothetical protein HYX14_04790 [Candidatus Woesearchaeota archaeon]|nr:hypothetical protein [Candidatus Woesearchaeota archaeon]
MTYRKLANPIEVHMLKVKYKDIFDLKAFYETMHEWLLEHEWGDLQENIDRWETFYGERVGAGNVKELWFQWRVWKEGKKIGSPFLNYYLDFNFHVIGLTTTEIVREGRKISVNKGELEILIKAVIDEVYKEKFAEQTLLKQVQELFTRRLYRKTVEQRKKELYQEVYVLQNLIKQWFKLKRYLPYEEAKGFYPSQAWPSHLKE